jgi:hypothetical protein
VIGWATVSYCQTYTFAAFTAGYNNLVVPTSLNNGVTWDDPDFAVPIGFDFEYFAQSTNSIQITGDGLGGDLKEDDCNVDPFDSQLIPYGADIMPIFLDQIFLTRRKER